MNEYLPHQLDRRESGYLKERFDRGVEMLESKLVGWRPVNIQTQELIREQCKEYKPCPCEEGCIYCESGKHGLLFRGKACINCIAGQVTINGDWIGDDDEIQDQGYEST